MSADDSTGNSGQMSGSDVKHLFENWPWGKGTRKDGVYQIPGQIIYDGMVLGPVSIPAELEKIKNELEFNEKDIISAGAAKTGSTWVNAILHLIVNNADTSVVNNRREDFTFLEFNLPGRPLQVEKIQAMPSPRLIKTHLPLRYFQRNIDKLSKGPKIVVPMRNPKDTLVSTLHFYRMNPFLGYFDGDWNEFFELFRQGNILYEDIFEFNLAWWAIKDHPNVHIVKYENLKKDTSGEVRKIAEFLGYPLTEKQISDIVEATSLSNMRKIPQNLPKSSDPNKQFFRKGQVGDWCNYFTEEQSSYIDKLCQEKYDPVGLTFDS